MSERDKRDALGQRIENVLVDLADWMAAVIKAERTAGEEWGYARRAEVAERREELRESIVELLMPMPPKEDAE